jgi:protein-S-isoprenylcysteine O-methyltransferase Ste14
MLHPVPSRATVVTAAVLLLAYFIAFRYAEPAPVALAIGLSLLAVGVLIRFVTNSVLKKNQEVSRDGLYAFCRHPMYVGSITLAVAIAILMNHPLGLLLIVAVATIATYRLRKEEAFLVANLPGYAEYRREVPVFPTPRSVSRAIRSGRFRQRLSLRQCFLNGEVFRANFYLPLLVASGLYLRHLGKLELPAWVFVVGGVVALAITAVSARYHPSGHPRSRLDYLLPAALAAGILALAAIPV